MRPAGGDLGLAGLRAFEEEGDQAENTPSAGCRDHAQVEMAIAGIALWRHIETTAHALSVHDRYHQGGLRVSGIIVFNLNRWSFEINENSLNDSDQISQQAACQRILTATKPTAASKPIPTPLTK